MSAKKDTTENLIPLLHRLNDELERLSREAPEQSFDSVRWDVLVDGFKDLPEGPARRLLENINTLVSFIKDESRKLRYLAVHDPLTQLYNRHFFNEIIDREAARSERSQEPLSIIMMDLDHFKMINDTLGHLAADDLLKDFARIIQGTIRRSDLAFRFGGDEFLILMLNADCSQSSLMEKRLLEAADRWNRDNAETKGCGISFCMGCATRDHGDNIHTTLRKADALMYLNKKTRKGRHKPHTCNGDYTPLKDFASPDAMPPKTGTA